MIRFKCYEPAGRVLELSRDDLTRHVIAFGATGSGKTTAFINPVLRQLLGSSGYGLGSRPGLVVLDPKGDDSAEKVRAFARQSGRESDVVLLLPGGNAWFDILGGFERLDQVEAYARRLLSGTRDLGHENAYWTESRDGLVQTALVLLLANRRPVRISEAISFMRDWWFSPDPSRIEPKLEIVRQLLSCGRLGPFTRQRLELALSEATHWANLDSRTRELHRSTLYNALRPLLSSVGQAFFCPKPIEFRPQTVLQGRILVVSVDAISNPDLARFIFRIVRQDFYSAVQARVIEDPKHDRLCGLIADELSLSVMPEDVQALSVIRAKGGFVVAATQSLNGLDAVLGWRGREALMANFNTTFFFSARESALDEYAMVTLGTRDCRDPASDEHGDLIVSGPARIALPQPICPPGSLARLQQHHAFAKLADGTCTDSPVWLEPNFFNSPRVTQSPPPDDLSEALAELRARKASQEHRNTSLPPFLVYMHQRGRPLLMTPAIVAAVWPLCVPSVSRNELLSRFEIPVVGLEGLPSCWLAGIYQWFLKNPLLAASVIEVAIKSGVLWPRLDRSVCLWGDGYVTIPESINLFIYPSLWRPISTRHRAKLLMERPDVRHELE